MSDTYFDMNLVTGARDADHVTSADDGALHAAMYGRDQYVMYGLEATLVNNNLIRISEGDALINGRHARIEHGFTAELSLANGSQSVSRVDLIVITYRKASSTDENAAIEVLTGTAAAGSAQPPDYIEGNILDGDNVVQFPLYRIDYTGVELPRVTKLYKNTMSLMDMLYHISIPQIGFIVENSGQNPGEVYPGTAWELYGVGEVSVCVDANNTEINAFNKHGGSDKRSISVANLPKHTHSVGAHTHAIGSHSHLVPEANVYTDDGGTHQHSGFYVKDIARSTTGTLNSRYGPATGSTAMSDNPITAKAGSHNHHIYIPPRYSNNSDGGNTGNNSVFNTGEQGSGTAFDIRQPFATVYRWIRVA